MLTGTANYSDLKVVNLSSSDHSSIKQAPVLSKRFLCIPWLLASDRLDCTLFEVVYNFFADLMIQEQGASIPIQEVDCWSLTHSPAF